MWILYLIPFMAAFAIIYEDRSDPSMKRQRAVVREYYERVKRPKKSRWNLFRR